MEKEANFSMLSHNKKQVTISNLKIVRISLLIGLGLILFLFESLIPRPLPWLKPGLAHVATLIALYSMGYRVAFIVVLVTILLESLLLGTFFNPTFFLSLVGGLTATFFMSICKQYLSSIFSIFGISIIGATAHNLTQLFLVEIIIVHRLEIFYLIPVMMISSLFTGFVVALISYILLSKINLVLDL